MSSSIFKNKERKKSGQLSIPLLETYHNFSEYEY